MYEYNADSASTLFEYGVVQQDWASLIGATKHGQGAGDHIRASMVAAWEACEIPMSETVHFLIDDDNEEEYTALFVLECAKSIGLKTKLIRATSNCDSDVSENEIRMLNFSWKNGLIIDDEGIPIKHIWKTWSWSTVFDDFEAVAKIRSSSYFPVEGTHPHLSDLLLSSQATTVLEPLWKCIPGNKAILPLLWEMYPNHPNLLRSEWTLTNELRSTGYAMKPIVSRGGQNVSLVEPCGDVVAETSGKFGERDVVYQELFPLSECEGHHSLVCGWIIGGIYSGTGIRDDEGLITRIDSPCPPLLIATDTSSKEGVRNFNQGDSLLYTKVDPRPCCSPENVYFDVKSDDENNSNHNDVDVYATLSNDILIGTSSNRLLGKVTECPKHLGNISPLLTEISY